MRNNPQRKRRYLWCAVAQLLAIGMYGASPAQAFQFDTGNPDLKISWDNTVKYSAAWRLQNPSDKLTSMNANPTNGNFNDGDLNFKRGQVSNRFDLLSEFDLSYQNVGMRLSGAAWYDSAYDGKNDNPGTFAAFNNNISVPANQFTNATRRLHGHDSEWLDAFVFGKFDVADSRATVRLGRHSVVWGETLFFGANGIAGGQSPTDLVKLLSVPNSTFKEITRPVSQVSGQVQLTPDVSVGAYYQFKWERNRLPAAGSYFGFADIVPDGGEQLFMPGPLSGGPLPADTLLRGADVKARDSGQGGVQLRLRQDETDYGLYAIRYHDKSFQQFYNFDPTRLVALGFATAGSYQLVYAQDINAYGASFSRTFGDMNVAGEASIRTNAPLTSDPYFNFVPGVTASNSDGNKFYAVGRTGHLNLSTIWQLPPNMLFNEAVFTGEVAWNRVLHVDRNPSLIDPNATRDASAMRFIFEPTYRQVLPGLDISIPIGVGYGLHGKSMAVGGFTPEGTGDVSIGINGTYLDGWKVGLTYTHFFGHEGNLLLPNATMSFKQNFADRDFISLSMRTTF